MEYLVENIDQVGGRTVNKEHIRDSIIEWTIEQGMARLTDFILSYWTYFRRGVLNEFINLVLMGNIKYEEKEEDTKNNIKYIETIQVLVNYGGKIPTFITEVAKIKPNS